MQYKHASHNPTNPIKLSTAVITSSITIIAVSLPSPARETMSDDERSETAPLLKPLLTNDVGRESKNSAKHSPSSRDSRHSPRGVPDADPSLPAYFPPAAEQHRLLSSDEMAYWQHIFQHAQFDDQAYAWAFQHPPPPGGKKTDEETGAADNKITQEKTQAASDTLPDTSPTLLHQLSSLSPEDIYHKYRLRWSLGFWSLSLFGVVAMVLLVSQVMFGVAVGPYTMLNGAMCLVFGLGGLCTLFMEERSLALFWAQVYYGFMLLLLLVGVPLGIYELTNNSARVDRFCQEIICSSKQRDDLLVFAFVGGSAGLLGWFFIFSAFCRVLFVYACAVERVALRTDGSSLYKWVRCTAYFLPNYPAIWRSSVFFMYSLFSDLWNRTLNCFTCHDLRNLLEGLALILMLVLFFPLVVVGLGATFFRTSGLILCALIWVGLFVTSAIMCDEEGNKSSDSPSELWCYMFWYMEFFAAVSISGRR
eukprot:gb/GEZN01007391.1/.p1 GENE.gb/GEZN01007391.1/~~gb/GEZN01007391.1/.p1  ORF type:complete len:477 (-),score=71.04 gb/GEZN01007391.1/:111-1541(-)